MSLEHRGGGGAEEDAKGRAPGGPCQRHLVPKEYERNGASNKTRGRCRRGHRGDYSANGTAGSQGAGMSGRHRGRTSQEGRSQRTREKVRAQGGRRTGRGMAGAMSWGPGWARQGVQVHRSLEHKVSPPVLAAGCRRAVVSHGAAAACCWQGLSKRRGPCRAKERCPGGRWQASKEAG